MNEQQQQKQRSNNNNDNNKNDNVQLSSTSSSSSSSSSSIYSSPIDTPNHHHHQQQPQQLSPTKIIINTSSSQQQLNSDYEELIEKTKQRMNFKFNCLEKQTGLNLSSPSSSTSSSSASSSSSKTTTNNVNNSTEQNKSDDKYLFTNNDDIIDNNNEFKLLKQSEQLLLMNECNRLKEELRLKNETIDKMYLIRTQVENELEDLTASLFEEANKMVYNANVLRDRSEKELYEANLKIDMLTAEVQALKLLVITSTPSKPNLHLHQQQHQQQQKLLINSTLNQQKQCNNNNNKNNNNKSNSSPKHKQQTPKKSPSNYELISNSKSYDLMKNRLSTISDTINNNNDNDDFNFNYYDDFDSTSPSTTITNEIDPIFYDEFQEWYKKPTLEPIDSNFMKRIYDEEIYPVFNFKNKQLTSLILRSIESNTLNVERIGCNNNNNDQQTKLPFPKKCSLLEIPRICRYRMCIDRINYNNNDNNNKLAKNNGQQWYYISQLCRNRITTVCDLFCYLRYIQQGLVKSNMKEIYWQIMQRRLNIAKSKLGFPPSSSTLSESNA